MRGNGSSGLSGAVIAVIMTALMIAPVLARANEGIPIRLRHLDNPKIEAFAAAIYLAEISFTPLKIGKKELKRIMRQSTYYAWAHISDDGIPELVIQFGDAPSCGNIGCETHIYRKTAKGYEHICEDTMLDSDSARGGPIILPKVENGYHVLDAGELLIHWAATPIRRGSLCVGEENPNFGLSG